MSWDSMPGARFHRLTRQRDAMWQSSGRSCSGHLWILTLGFACLAVLCTVTDIDLFLSARFYAPHTVQGWFLQRAAPWSWLYDYGQYPAILMAIGAMLVLLGSLVRRSRGSYRRHCLVLILAVALGPGLLTNGILKPVWGRPRPRQIVQFGGSQPYRPWWRPAGPGAGKSFPSGHASMGYILLAGASVIPCRRRLWPRELAFASALGYGTLMGIGRVVQGGHFASDVVWAGCLMCLTVIGLRAVAVQDLRAP
jgi:membrane-associated PAP2 superfamily phosphatase